MTWLLGGFNPVGRAIFEKHNGPIRVSLRRRNEVLLKYLLIARLEGGDAEDRREHGIRQQEIGTEAHNVEI